MKIHDISLPVFSGMVVWPGNPAVRVTRMLDQACGDAATVSDIALGVHTGTHLDAPLHFLPDGAGVDALALEDLCGPAWVADFPDADALTADVFAQARIPAGVTRLLCRTRNSALWAADVRAFQTDYVAVTADGAQWLVERGMRVIGVDYLSVAPYADGVRPHVVLLRAGMIPVEGLNLTGITPGAYQLYCLPLKLLGADGAPARVILVEA